MIDKRITAVALIGVGLLAGCQTVAGTTCGVAHGVATGVVSTTEGAVNGAVNDTATAVGVVGYIDDWIKKTLW